MTSDVMGIGPCSLSQPPEGGICLVERSGITWLLLQEKEQYSLHCLMMQNPVFQKLENVVVYYVLFAYLSFPVQGFLLHISQSCEGKRICQSSYRVVEANVDGAENHNSSAWYSCYCQPVAKSIGQGLDAVIVLQNLCDRNQPKVYEGFIYMRLK